MDVGQAADLPEGIAGKRLPPWIQPKVDNETRGKLRPDILIIEGLNSNTIPQENTIEVGYTGYLSARREEETAHHKPG